MKTEKGTLPLNILSYPAFVANILKSPQQIMEELTLERVNLVHTAIGVAGEAGELLDLVKKTVINNHPLDRAKVVKELGDIEYYLEALRQTVGVTREEVIEGNLSKLFARYGGTYSDEASIARADVNGEGGLGGK